MFNFKVYDRAVCDPELEKNELRVLYLILNNMSLNKVDRIEIFNGFVMDTLGISESTVRRSMKSLEEKGYIGRVITGTSKNRKGNVIYIPYESVTCEVTHDVTGDPPYNVHDNKHHVEKNQVSEVEGTDNFQDTHDNKKEKSRYVTGLFDELSELNKRYFKSADAKECNDIINRFNDVWNGAMERYQEGYFTQGQVDALSRFYDNFTKRVEEKETFFKQRKNKRR